MFRLVADAAGPPVFGLCAGVLFGGAPQALTYTVLAFLAAPLLSGLLALLALRTYPHDVAAVARSHA